LPAPEGEFSVTLRIYWRRPEVNEGRWTPPPVEKVQ